MSWRERVFGGKRAEPAAVSASTERWCSFCGLNRRDVLELIGGPNQLHICDRCLLMSVEIVHEERCKRGACSPVIDALLAIAEHAGPRARHAELRPSLQAAILLAGGAPEPLRRAALLARRVEDHATALAAWTAIADEHREDIDRIDRAQCLVELRRYDEALALVDEVPAPVDDEGVIHSRLWRSLLELRRGGASRPQLAVHLQTARQLAGAVASLPDGRGKAAARLSRLDVITRAALALGELEDAEEAAQDAALLAPDRADVQAALADVLRARGDLTAARRAWVRARDLAHPDGELARTLAQAGDEPYR